MSAYIVDRNHIRYLIGAESASSCNIEAQ